VDHDVADGRLAGLHCAKSTEVVGPRVHVKGRTSVRPTKGGVMAERRPEDPSREGTGLEARDDDPGREQVEGRGDEGQRNAESTPPIGDQPEDDGQTQVDAPDAAGGAEGEPSRTE
jgi:hypothetical protein